MNERAYLKCEYYPGIFSSERNIFFNTKTGKEKYIIQRHNFFAKDKSSGLTSIIIFDAGKTNSKILIAGTNIGELRYFQVPNEEIISQQKFIEYLTRE